MKKILIVGLFIISTGLLFSDMLTTLEINNAFLFASLTFVSFLTLTIILGRHLFKTKSNYFKTIVISTCILIGVLTYILRPTDWKTQTILYTHGHFAKYTVEFQMQDIGARGYNKRTVKRIKILPAINIVTNIDDTNKIGIPWFRADINVNELELKEP